MRDDQAETARPTWIYDYNRGLQGILSEQQDTSKAAAERGKKEHRKAWKKDRQEMEL